MLDVQRSKISKPRSPKKAKKPTSSAHAAEAASSALIDDSSKKTKESPKSEPSKSIIKPHTTAAAPTMAATTTTSTFPLPALKDLASSDPSLRRKSLTSVLEHLDTRLLDAPLTSTQCQQLWRAFYVALYMHDSKSAVSVQNLARTLAGTLRQFWVKDVEIQASRQGQGKGGEVMWAWSAGWATAFWDEMAREWAGVDQWRMNKVLMLVRFFVGEGVALALEGTAAAEGEKGNDGAWPDFVADVVALPLEVERSLPDGLRMHVLDVWGDEIERVQGTADGEDGGEDEGGDQEESSTDEHRKEVARMLIMAAKELSVFRQGEANVPRNVRAKAKEIVQGAEA